MTIGFPDNVIAEFETSIQPNLTEFTIVHRPVRLIDPAQTLGIYPVDSAPTPSSQQIGQWEPSLLRYNYRIAIFVKHAQEIEARRIGSAAAKIVGAILYRDPDLRVRLAALSEDMLGSREKVQQYGVTRLRYHNNEFAKYGFVHLTVADIWVETEMIEGV